MSAPCQRPRCFLLTIAGWVVSFTALALGQEAPSGDAQTQHQHAMAAHEELFLPREASGTAWLPDETPMYGVQKTLGTWEIMLHGNLFGQYLYEPGDRHRTGGSQNHQISSVNWLMLNARRSVGASRVGFRAMGSAEPWTVNNCGFINLLASGEMCEGDTIHDRQHPHDALMELAVEYDRPLTSTLRWQVYAGIAGDPALGPVPFPHRVSAMPNPIAPITHHWLDSSHITFGLVTTGVYTRRWKAETSLFNGREPDENRTDVDFGKLDSVSGRITFMPTHRWAFQISAGHLHAAEAEFPPLPRGSVDRATSSATYHRILDGGGIWAMTLAYGMNRGPEVFPGVTVVDLVTHAGLAESNLTLRDRHTFFGRVEVVGKPGDDLHIHEAPITVFTVSKVEAGYTRYFSAWRGITPGIGGVASVSIVPSALAARYSGNFAPGFGVFLNVRPARHVM